MTLLGRSAAAWLVLLVGTGAGVALGQEEPEREGWTTPPAMTHELEGRASCTMCHTPGAIEQAPDMPTDHEGRPNELCLICHAPDAAVQTTVPPVITHKMEGRAGCVMCHTAGAMEQVPDMPANHEGRTNDYCTLCHAPPEQ